MLRYTEKGGALTFAVRVVPRASRSEVVGEHDGALRVRVAAPPVEGVANEELVRTLARALGVPTRAVEITSGQASKSKLVRVVGAERERLLGLVSGSED
ncbi:MAG TPA: DUF167 domain-containing protein [Pyrinomonadaceae bacterium]|jgi:uncharacterized protein (TIGR00251 family)|nr:DUF167 domain-containing protein [Pyrinomonadaceae bacterium]